MSKLRRRGVKSLTHSHKADEHQNWSSINPYFGFYNSYWDIIHMIYNSPISNEQFSGFQYIHQVMQLPPNFFTTSKGDPVLLSSHSSFPHPRPWQLLISFYLLWTFHINGLTHYCGLLCLVTFNQHKGFFFNWSIVDLQCFRYTAKWFNYISVCVYVCVHILFQILSHYRLLQDNLCYATGSC